MNIAIVGAGAMGCLYGVKLAQAGHQVTLLHRRPEFVKILRHEGLQVHSETQEQTVFLPVYLSSDKLQQFEGIIFFVKGPDTQAAAKDAEKLCGPHTWILTLQNGLGHAERLAEVFGPERILAGTTSFGAYMEANHLYERGQGETHIGALLPSPVIQPQKVAQLLAEAGLNAKATDNVEGLLWSKFLINVGINALTALAGCENGKLLERSGWLRLADEAVSEAYAAARKKNIQLLYSDPFEKVREVAQATADNRSSMLQDLLRHKQTEIDYMNGAAVQICHDLGLPAPVNSALTCLIQTMQKNS